VTDPTLFAPFPYFGGKRRAASLVWKALGDPSGYVEPFAGSAAVLLGRPAFKGRRERLWLSPEAVKHEIQQGFDFGGAA